jgi:hypothetical protein
MAAGVSPQCICFDTGTYTGSPSGNMIFYTGNADNSITRYVWSTTPNAGTTLVSAGAGTAMGINAPRGMVTDTFGRLYVTSQLSNTIVRLNITNQLVVSASIFFSGALLSQPGPLAIDNLNNIYVANKVSEQSGCLDIKG